MMCETVGDRPSNVVNYPEAEKEYLRQALIEKHNRERREMDV